MRRRIALSTASVVMVAVGTTTAFALTSNNGPAPDVATASPRLTVSVSPSVSASPSPSPSGAPSSPAASHSAVSSSPASSHPTAADPHKVIDGAWLTGKQLPFANTFNWRVQPSTWQSLTPTVSYYGKESSFQALTVCGDPADLFSRVLGAQGRNFYGGPDGSGNAATQFVFFFADHDSAKRTFDWLQGQYAPSCMADSKVTHQMTAGDGLASAVWLSRKTSTGPVDLAPYNREYFVLRGTTIGYVSVSSTSNLPATYNDAAQLSTIAAHLCVYGGPCS